MTTATGDGLGTWRAEACPGKYWRRDILCREANSGRLADYSGCNTTLLYYYCTLLLEGGVDMDGSHAPSRSHGSRR